MKQGPKVAGVPKLLVGLLVLVGLIVTSCGDDGGNDPEVPEDSADPDEAADPDATDEPADPDAADGDEAGPTATDLCARATLVEPPGVVASPELVEISGIAASRRHDGVIWAHNDSGALPEVFAVGEDGTDLGRFTVEGAEAVDWEDMTIGRGPDSGVDHLYVGDLGDNTDEPLRLERPIAIYRMAEPGEGPEGAELSPAEAERIDVAYADGPRDAETLMADPVDGTLFIVSKQWDGALAGVYEVPAEVVLTAPAPSDPVALERVADVPGTEGVFVTGGAVSPDGSLVALRTYTEVRLFDRAPDETVADALARGARCAIEVAEPQGEAVAFGSDGGGLVTISEGEAQPVNWRRWG